MAEPLQPDLFGRIISGDDVEQAAIDTLRAGMDMYLTEIEIQKNLAEGFYARPMTYEIVDRFMKWTDEALPAILVVSTGTADQPPMRQGNGYYRATFALAVGAVVSARDLVTTRRMARHYTAAIRTLLDQQHIGPGLGAIVRWVDESYDPLPDSDLGKTQAAGQATFTVEIDEVLNSQGGPLIQTPPNPGLAGTQWPIAEIAKPPVIIDIEGRRGTQ